MPMVLMSYGGSGEPKLMALPDGDMLVVAKAFAEATEAKQTIKIYSVDNSGVEQRYPDVHIYTPVVDEGLNAHKFIVPGLGDFGDRLYGTL